MIELLSLMMIAFSCFLVFITIAHAPIIPIIRVIQHDLPEKKEIIKCFIIAYLKVLLTIPIDLSAPIIVPIALLFTKTSDNTLPSFFWMWDNDISLNGDIRKENSWDLLEISNDLNNQSEISKCYWSKGNHPRSFYARWVWLGLRNRASKLSQELGTSDTGEIISWKGDTWYLNKLGNNYRYFELLPVLGVFIRMHCGYKIPIIPGEHKAPVVSIGFSLRK